MAEKKKTWVFSLNPSVDVEWKVPHVLWEEKNNILSERRWAGGKGVNVARWFQLLSADTSHRACLALPLGGLTGQEMRGYLESDGFWVREIPIAESTRANIIVTTEEKKQLRFNPLGPELSSTEWEEVYHIAQSEPAELALFSGALPRKAPLNTYKKLIELFNQRGIPTLLDCDGAAFAEGIQAHPFLVKPNHFELEQWAGRRLNTPEAICEAGKELSGLTSHSVLVSLGAEGAFLFWREDEGECNSVREDVPLSPVRIFRAHSPEVEVQNRIGAGDSMLAGAAFALAERYSPEDCLRMAIAASTAAVSKPAGVLPEKETVLDYFSQIQVQEQQ